MISDPSFVLYACVSKGTTVLAEFSSGDRDLETLALQCLEKTPQFHTTFSHTIRKRIYSFLMEDPFIYFTILDEDFGSSEGLAFLESVKCAFLKIWKTKSVNGFDDFTSHCFHEEFSPAFHGLVSPTLESLNGSISLNGSMSLKSSRTTSLDSRSSEKKTGFSGMLYGKSGRYSKKKKKKYSDEMDDKKVSDLPLENKVDLFDDDLFDDDAHTTREFSVSVEKNGVSCMGIDGYQIAKRRWRRHVWTVLLIDLVVCCVLFGVWLWICKGFECMAS